MHWYDFIYLIRWQDVVDVLFFAFLLYRLTVLFWGTNAFQILLGISFLWLLGLGAQATGLMLTNWILQGLGAVIMIVMVVVFRNEIRDTLFRINPLYLILGNPRKSVDTNYPALARSIFSLAGKRIGALVVFPRRRKVDEFIRQGVELRSLFSQELFESIFHPRSPLHDGAIILENGRIIQAACFLPMTKKENLPLKYGSRHRAAMGITEKTDALVVAVSEERGEVSVAEGGQLRTVPSAEALERELGDLLEQDYHKGDRKPDHHGKVFPRNWQGRLAALAVSLVIWFLFVGEKESLITMTAPLEFRNLSRTMQMVSSSADRVEMQISGRQHMIASLKPDQLKAFLDLDKAKSGSNLFPLSAANVTVPVGVRVTRIFPSQVMVFMEVLATRGVNVSPTFTGSLPNDKRMAGCTVDPRQVLVTGPYSIMRDLEEIPTEPVNIDALDKNHEAEVGIILSPASIQLAPNQPTKVRVKVLIVPSAVGDAAGPPN